MDKNVEDIEVSTMLWQLINIIGFVIIVFLLYLLIKFLRKKFKK